MKWLFRWLRLQRQGDFSIPISITGAELDPCQFPGCGIRRQDHSFKAQRHHFAEAS